MLLMLHVNAMAGAKYRTVTMLSMQTTSDQGWRRGRRIVYKLMALEWEY